MPHRPVKSILGMAGAAVWMVSGCAATTPSLPPFLANDPAFRNEGHAAHHQTGLAHLAAGRHGLALFELRKALRDNPRSIETLNAIAVAYDHLGRFDQSRGYYDRAFALDPNAVQTLNNLGRSAALEGDSAAAIAWLERAQRQDFGAREVAENLADARMQAASSLAASPPPAPANTATLEPLRQSAGEPVREPIRAWVERTDRLHQTLVTTAPFEIVQTLAALDLRPEVINVAGLPDLSLHNRPARTGGDARRDSRSDAQAPTRTASSANPAGSPVRLEISNGAGRRGMAARMRSHLGSELGSEWGSEAAAVVRLTNAAHFAHTTSAIFYRPGFAASAAAFSGVLPVRVDLIEDDRQRSDVRLRLGGDLLEFDLRLLNKG